jgi:hypothetical protein
MKMAEEMEVTEVLTPEAETQLDTDEPTTDQLISDDLGDAFDAVKEDSTSEAKGVSEEAETADEGNVDEEAKPKVVLTRRETEALKHADMEDAVKGMDPSAVKTFAKKLADERSAKDKAMSEKGKLQEQLEAKELAESDSFDIDSDENEYLPDEAKEAFKAKDAQLKAIQERLDSLEQGSDHTVERFWDKLDAKQYPQYSEGDDVTELRGEIEGDADAFMAAQPGITRAEALTKCLKLATIDDQVRAEVAKQVAKKTRKIRGGVTPKMSGGQRLPATGTETEKEFLEAEYDRLVGI